VLCMWYRKINKKIWQQNCKQTNNIRALKLLQIGKSSRSARGLFILRSSRLSPVGPVLSHRVCWLSTYAWRRSISMVFNHKWSHLWSWSLIGAAPWAVAGLWVGFPLRDSSAYVLHERSSHHKTHRCHNKTKMSFWSSLMIRSSAKVSAGLWI